MTQNLAPNQHETAVLPDGQPDWEARYKGQVTATNKIHSQLTASQQALNDAVAARQTAESSGQSTLSDIQTQLATAQNDLKAKTALLDAKTTENQTFQQQLVALQGKEKVRSKLVEFEAADILPFFEAGDLSFDSLEDAAIKAKAEGFRTRLQKLTGAAPVPPVTVNPITGASVPAVTPAGGTNNQKPEVLYEWLMNPVNRDNAEFQTKQELYYSLIKP